MMPQYRPQSEPVYQTALSGSTPSGGAAPNTLDAQLLMTQSAGSQGMAPVGGEMFAALPEIGPVPGFRPHHVPGYDGSGYAAAYAEVETVPGALAFDAILVRNGSLTESSILSSVAKGGITLSKGL